MVEYLREVGRGSDDDDALLTPGEVARMFGVDPKTVTRWAKSGKLNPVRTLGGHRRYRSSEISSLLRGEPVALPTTPPSVDRTA